ncbi:MAG: rhomboid family intramembrane serine protease [Pseudomonadota bacterium]
MLLGGGLVWLFGRTASHVGASGWVYGLWALNISYACFDRSFGNILLALFVAFVYGGLSYGLLPMDRSVSFEMHGAGALAGVFCAYVGSAIKRSQRNTASALTPSASSIK